jgi:hypothetical protein
MIITLLLFVGVLCLVRYGNKQLHAAEMAAELCWKGTPEDKQ